MKALPVTDTSQVPEARRAASDMAHSLGFGEADTGRVAIVVTELGTNLIKHGGGGELLVGSFEDPSGSGLEIVALDKGRGIARIEDALRDGHSTAGTQGHGLGAARRQSQAFDIVSWPGNGTGVLARVRPGRHGQEPTDPVPSFGGIAVPKPGETACGDAWRVEIVGRTVQALLADGLGHGILAAEAAASAVDVFGRARGTEPAGLLRLVHEGLRPTRGAAVAVAALDGDAGSVVYGGIGNISGVVVSPGSTRRMLSYNGTAGHTLQKIQCNAYPVPDGALVVMHSDGVGTGWTLDRYPGLQNAHPTLVAAILYRDFARGRDDACVLVLQRRLP